VFLYCHEEPKERGEGCSKSRTTQITIDIKTEDYSDPPGGELQRGLLYSTSNTISQSPCAFGPNATKISREDEGGKKEGALGFGCNSGLGKINCHSERGVGKYDSKWQDTDHTHRTYISIDIKTEDSSVPPWSCKGP